MKLAAIFSVWGDWDILEHSFKNINDLVDGVIIIYSTKSNYGELCEVPEYWKDKVYSKEFIPDLHLPASQNERNKRNFGLRIAEMCDFTHFIQMDSDEIYEPGPFLKEKQRFIDNQNLAGLVCASQVYFKTPELTIGLDTTRVTFIHKITPGLQFENTNKYPFSYEGDQARIDPTRRLNITKGVEWSPIIMHHFSYIRSDLKKKIRNSTASKTLTNSAVLEDYKNATDGYFCKMYGKTLHKCENIFNLPEIIDHSL